MRVSTWIRDVLGVFGTRSCSKSPEGEPVLLVIEYEGELGMRVGLVRSHCLASPSGETRGVCLAWHGLSIVDQ